jgi:hypothetical protein
MGAPESGMKAAEQPTAETLLTAFRTIKDDERARHVGVLDYWLSIRGEKEFPPLHDLDPLEISDAAPCSILLELIGGGQDAEIRHPANSLSTRRHGQADHRRVHPILAVEHCLKLPDRRHFARFPLLRGQFQQRRRAHPPLGPLPLPLSSCGSRVDYVYAFVSPEKASTKAARPAAEPQPLKLEEPPAEEPSVEEAVAVAVESVVEPEAVEESPPEEAAAVAEEAVVEPEAVVEAPQKEAAAVGEAIAEPETVEQQPVEPEQPIAEVVEQPETIAEASVETSAEPEPELEIAPEPAPDVIEEAPAATGGPGFSRFRGLAQLTGFYGQGVLVADPLVDVDMRRMTSRKRPRPRPRNRRSQSPKSSNSSKHRSELDEIVAAEPEAPECAPWNRSPPMSHLNFNSPPQQRRVPCKTN